MKKIILVAGARPNFTKIAPILRVLANNNALAPILVHTGQHYDENMSGSFFSSLGIKDPDYNLNAGSGSHAVQTAEIMVGFEKVCLEEKPDMVIVVGDVNSTIAAGLVAKKLHIDLAHVEAGLRSFDRKMPEEINRMATDAITDLFFTTEPQAQNNLMNEGHPKDAIHFVGNVMIDNLYYQLSRLQDPEIADNVMELKKKLPGQYFCLTLHRPSNVDHEASLRNIVNSLVEIAARVPIVFPCHPRTRKNLEKYDLLHEINANVSSEPDAKGIILLEPLSYNEFLYFWKDATAVLTDSGGLQEETTAMNIPCLTIRENTERPVTTEVGSNILVGQDMEKLKSEVVNILEGKGKKGKIPDLWDGRASERIVSIVETHLL